MVDGVCVCGKGGGKGGVSYGRPVRGSGTAQWYAASDSVVVLKSTVHRDWPN